ncbi:MAG: hypothetical protein JO250_20875 [Armatimonadetes bacterium]|nr:hypothetical protein [Armatimonadota bacterium]
MFHHFLARPASRALTVFAGAAAGVAAAYLAAFPLGRALAGPGLSCGEPQESRFAGLPGVAAAAGDPPGAAAEELVEQYLGRQEVRPLCPAERISSYRVTSLRPLGAAADDGPDSWAFDLRFDVRYPLGVGDWIGWGGRSFGPWVLGKHAQVTVVRHDGRYAITGMGMG